jgi:hypothetical protein
MWCWVAMESLSKLFNWSSATWNGFKFGEVAGCCRSFGLGGVKTTAITSATAPHIFITRLQAAAEDASVMTELVDSSNRISPAVAAVIASAVLVPTRSNSYPILRLCLSEPLLKRTSRRGASAGEHSNRSITQHGRSVHRSGLPAEIPNYTVLRASIVPHQQITSGPPVAESEIVMGSMLIEVVEQRPALFYRHPLEMPCRNAVDVECAPSGFRMGPHNRM